MNDMSLHRPLPTAPDHELHDALLVAQAASGDELQPDLQRLAEQLISTCGACASLAADLRAVSGAVAWEPTPPRRRDHRISAEQADELRGSLFSRFMRRLAMPQSRGLRPAAAGVMSLGLLFVVAGTAWPGDMVQLTSVDEAAAPLPLSTAPLVEEPVAPAVEPADLLENALRDSVEAEFFGEFREGSVGEDDSDQPAAARSAPDAASKAVGQVEPEAQADEIRGQAGEGLKSRAAETEVAAGSDGEMADEAESLVQPDALYEAESLVQQDALGAADPDASPMAADSARLEGAPLGAADDGLDGSALSVEPADDGIDIETLLVTLGVVLAIGGGALLLLAWLARRRQDPLLR